MRILFYNIRYGTGSGWDYHLPLPFTGFFRKTSARIRRIGRFVDSMEPDIICLVEVDGGSYRQDSYSQAGQLASMMGWEYKFSCKYGSDSPLNRLPIFSSHGNALLSSVPILSSQECYFSRGVKRTFLSVEFEDFHVVLSHLSLGRQARKIQLQELARHCSLLSKPVILVGDLNLLHGPSEMRPLMQETSLKDTDKLARPTFPSRKPKLRLDYLLASEGISVKNVEIPGVRLSDHLPVICDFTPEKNRQGDS